MSMFSGVEKEEPSARGIFARFKAFRSSFAEDSPASLPIAGVAGAKDDSEPHFRTSNKPVNPKRDSAASVGQPMTLGMRLRMGDIEDVDVHESDANVTPNQASLADASMTSAGEEEVRSTDFVTVHVGPSGKADEAEAVGGAGEPVLAPIEETAAPREATHSDTLMPVDDGGSTNLVEPDVTVTLTGLPQLFSAEALTFKRILCERSADAALRITDAARREFVAVDLQAGVAIVVTTPRFHENPLYSTYLKDLARADIAVREEMVATEGVIAQIYAKDKRSAAIIPESSRAIGTFRDVIEASHSYRATDVHWEYRDFTDEVEVRFRVNGDLYSYRKMPKALVRRALSAAYQDLVQRNTNSGETFQPSAPQSAMIPLVAHMDIVNLRWQSAPLVGGFDVALRLLDGNFKNYYVRQPEEMGLEASQLAVLDALGRVSGGVSILTGETGSAKSTLLRAMSYNVPGRDLIKQYVISQPSEYPHPWLSEISIQHRPDESDAEANRKCAEVIRTIMRMDPDDTTVTEIRDAVVAALVAELALTGHPVRTTLHADSAIGAFMRLAGGRLQLPMDEVSSERFVNAVGNQKLIPLLCPHCKVPARDVLDAAQLQLLEARFGLDTSKMACRDEAGCEHCRLPGLFTRSGKVAAGTKGQTLAMELLRPTPEFLDRVAVRDWRGAEKVWRRTRVTGFADADMTGKTIYEHALYKASTGIIDPRFINEAMRPFADYRIVEDRYGRIPS
ncbi:ATPase, T2SS/T4P/T4SS family [Paraburkholderia sp. BL10I2N1]|uniref:ATPase, T2SS/T4P/T4SS family n=1 Tax=Paraburkholderia sp. BL10I2N1 TaxID=1938796 RepID=UPI0010603FA5|nr:ATPase, T2SS/T4P/T4SS family [Paraburkholderia sp. BL10I2N1]TDN59093.1 type II secretory ATPase GspE/PulE/Tfp pilus assembly ATPase PilB-like protein [Paraburkholderia sp. BL10I2N1]